MARLKKIGGVYVPIRGDYTEFQADMAKVREIARAQGTAISNELHNALSSDQISRRIADLTKSVGTATRAAAAKQMEPVVKEIEALASVAGVAKDKMAKLQQQMLQTAVSQQFERSMSAIQRQTGAGVLDMARLRLAYGDTAGAAKALGGAALGAAPALAAVGLAVGFAAKASWDAALRIERLNKAYTSITGSSSAADAQLRRIYETSRSLGVEFFSAAEGAKNLFAAAKGTTLEADAERIFESFSRASASLSLSQEEMQGIFLALGQMMSKGKVQAEELRGQLGERLPGAFQLAAKAMGVTTAELDKMLEQGQVLAEDLLPKMADLLATQYKDGASEAQSATNKLATEWERFKASLMDTDAAVAGINKVANALKFLSDEEQKEKDRRSVVAQMARDGITGKEIIGEGQYGYSQSQIDAYLARKQAGNRQRDGWFQGQRSWADVSDASLSNARKLADDYLKNTESSKIAKANREYEDATAAVRKHIAILRSNGEATELWEGKLAAMAEEHQRTIEGITKKSDAAGKQAANAAYRTADALREVQQESMRLAGDEVGLARLDMEDKFAKWQKAIGGVTPEMVKLHAEMEKALNLGLAPNAYFNATKGLKATIAERQAELDALDVEGGKRINPAGYARGQVMSKFEKFKLGDEWKVASEEQRKQIALLYGGLGDKAALQASDEINRDFLEKAASTFKGRADLERAALEEQMRMYSGHVQNRALLDEWYQRRFLETSKEGADGARLALLDYYDETQNAAKQWGGAVTNVAKGFEDAMVAACTKGKLEFSALADSIIADLARIAIQKSITGPLSKGLDGLLGSMFSSGLGGSGSSAVGSMNIDGGLEGWANGGVFNSSDLHSHLNKVVDTPTFFRFAKGGVFGEAGPEAIMPLARDGQGRLGVRSQGSSAPVTVNVINNTGQPVQTRESQDARGGRSIEVMVGEAVAKQVRRHGTEANTAMRQTFGARQTLIGR